MSTKKKIQTYLKTQNITAAFFAAVMRRVPLISDSDRRVPADWGQESQASSWVEAWNSACLSRCPRGERPLVELDLEPGVFSERCTGKLPLRVDCTHTCVSQHPRIRHDHEPKVVGGALFRPGQKALSGPHTVTMLAAFGFCRTGCH